jgi:RNA polymerase sigma-70 factor (ECF subfamily)
MVARLRLGEHEAYETLVRTHGPRMLSVARGYLPTQEDAENATQSAFLLAFRFIHRFDGASLLSTWLHRIVVNSALMRLRYNRRHPEVRLDALGPEGDSIFGRPGHAAPSVAEIVGRRDAHERMLRAVQSLPQATRAATRLHVVYGRTLSETSLLLGRPLGAVKGSVERGRKSLRALLTPAG